MILNHSDDNDNEYVQKWWMGYDAKKKDPKMRRKKFSLVCQGISDHHLLAPSVSSPVSEAPTVATWRWPNTISIEANISFHQWSVQRHIRNFF